jgi:hypothetical protein
MDRGCPSRDRLFLDAGKFTDLKHDTFSNKIKALLKGKQK